MATILFILQSTPQPCLVSQHQVVVNHPYDHKDVFGLNCSFYVIAILRTSDLYLMYLPGKKPKKLQTFRIDHLSLFHCSIYSICLLTSRNFCSRFSLKYQVKYICKHSYMCVLHCNIQL